MDSLICCAARRRPKINLNPLEGRANLRLEGRRDYDDVVSLEGAASPPANCEEGQSSSSFTSNRLAVPGEESPRRDHGEDSPKSNGMNSDNSDMPRSFKNSFENLAKVIAQGKAAAREAKVKSDHSGSDLSHTNGYHSKERCDTKETSPPRSPERAPSYVPSSSSSSENGDAEENEESSADVDRHNSQLQDLAKKLRKTIWKFPSSSKSFFGSGLKERFFAITISSAEAKTPTSLNYWEDEQSIKKEEPLGTIPISSITAIQWLQDIEKGQQVTVTHYKEGKQGPTMVLTLKFASSKEAKSWSGELQTFGDVFKRCSPSASEDKKPRSATAPVAPTSAILKSPRRQS